MCRDVNKKNKLSTHFYKLKINSKKIIFKTKKNVIIFDGNNWNSLARENVKKKVSFF